MHNKVKRMKLFRHIFILGLLVFNLSFAQFGQNKVQYDVFDWNFIQSKHFNIYFNGENTTISDFCAKTAESAYESISTLYKEDEY